MIVVRSLTIKLLSFYFRFPNPFSKAMQKKWWIILTMIKQNKFKLSLLSYAPQGFIASALFFRKSEKLTDEPDSVIITSADRLYTEGNYTELYSLLVTNKSSSNVEILWRLSRASFEMGKAAKTKNEKISFFEEGMSYVKRGFEIDNNHGVLHKWFAILNDYRSRCEGVKSRIQNAYVNKEHMMKSVELSASDPTVVHMLGYWCFAFASLTWYERKFASIVFATPPTSTFEEALSHFEKAEQMEPGFYSTNLLMIGKCFEKLGDEKKAIEYLKKTVEYKGNTNDDEEARAEAAAMLKNCGVN